MTDISYDERKKRLSSSTQLGGGKIPPQAIEMEEKVLGSILNESMYLIDIEDSLRSEHFYHESNKKIYEAIVSLSRQSFPIDVSTVSNELRRTGVLEIVGGSYAILKLTELVSGNVEYHSKIIIQKWIQRELIRNASETIQGAYEDTTDVFDLVRNHEKGVSDILSETHRKQGSDINELLDEALEVLSQPVVEGLTGVGSGFTDLDAVTGGWQPTDLIIVAARPGMGKTAFVVQNARNAAVKFGKKGVVFSLEMSSIQLTQRILSNETSIHLERIRKKKVLPEEFTRIQAEITDLRKSGLIIDDTASLNIFEFRAKCRRLKAQQDIQWIIVDYLQLMSGSDENGKNGNRDNELGKISRALKSVAKELNIPVIALSQLSRAVESRASANGKRPLLSDLRESGNIEQDADMVIFLYRPEYYGIVVGPSGEDLRGLCEVIIAKHRNGICDTVDLDFNGSVMRFKDRAKELPREQSNVKMPVQNDLFIPNRTGKIDDEDEDAPF